MSLAALTHATEFAVYARSCWASLHGQPDACQSTVLQANANPSASLDAHFWAACQGSMAPYSLERPFTKPVLAPEDRELMGRGP